MDYFLGRRLVLHKKVITNIPWWHKNESLDKGWTNKVVDLENSALISNLNLYPKNQLSRNEFSLMALNFYIN